jgi:hypothetical protein
VRILARWVARPGNQRSPEAQLDVIPALGLDQEQASVVLAALEDAATLRREVIGNCPDCRSADNRVCTEHEGSWETAKEYDQLRWHLGNSCRDGEPNQDTGAVTGRVPTEHVDSMKPEVDRDRGGWEAHATAALEPSRAEWPGEPQADPGSASNQITGKNKANDYQPDREAGE